MTEHQAIMIHALEKALVDARSGRLSAFAFMGVGRGEHAIAYAFDDAKPDEQLFLLGAIDKAESQIRADAAREVRAATRYDYDISDDGVMAATDAWQRDDDATWLRLLACHSVNVSMAVIAGWSDDQVKAADIWAWTSALSASDHDDIQVPPRPDFLGEHLDTKAAL